MELSILYPILIAATGAIAGLAWKVFTQGNLITTGNNTIDAIVKAAQDQAIASDCYMRITADGKITVDEEEEHRKKAADANISLLYAIETITGRPIYNRTEVPLPLPVGGKRDGEPLECKPVPEPMPEPVITPAEVPA